MLQLKQIYVFTIPKQESMKERLVNFLVLSNAENSSDNRSCKKAFTSFYYVQQMWKMSMIFSITDEYDSKDFGEHVQLQFLKKLYPTKIWAIICA